jgi:hypothetical protein
MSKERRASEVVEGLKRGGVVSKAGEEGGTRGGGGERGAEDDRESAEQRGIPVIRKQEGRKGRSIHITY